MVEINDTGRTDDRIVGDIRTRLAHDSARKHVSGEALYIDDLAEPAGLLHLHPVLSTRPRARVVSLDISAAIACEGVVTVLTADDVPGTNDFGHEGLDDDWILASERVAYVGQVICVIAAETLDAARMAAKTVRIDFADETPILTVDQAVEAASFLQDLPAVTKGDCAGELAAAPHRISGTIESGAQDHFYLEGHIAMALPKEDDDVHIYSSTQDPTAVQHLVARIMDIPANAVTVEVRRMGGAFGGKETQATQFAAIVAIAARKTGRPAKFRLDRDDDMRITGKRHEFASTYEVGFDDNGRIRAFNAKMGVRCGNAEDQSPYILARALNHLDNCYYLEHVDFSGLLCKTNTVSACAFRGFGTPQAFVVTERVIDRIAFQLGLDPLEVRKVNF
ncbi:MAG: hypothetical protein E2O93_00005, partial [Alphaproteobacteria bacterium]